MLSLFIVSVVVAVDVVAVGPDFRAVTPALVASVLLVKFLSQRVLLLSESL